MVRQDTGLPLLTAERNASNRNGQRRSNVRTARGQMTWAFKSNQSSQISIDQKMVYEDRRHLWKMVVACLQRALANSSFKKVQHVLLSSFRNDHDHFLNGKWKMLKNQKFSHKLIFWISS